MISKLAFKLFSPFSQISARKYLQSISETALLYRPSSLRLLSQQQSMKDRVVQTFFDTTKSQITVNQSMSRLSDVKQYSTPAHSFYMFSLPFKTNPILLKKMIQFQNKHIRVGRMLELMDYMAANVAYRYCTPESQKQKSMEQLDFNVVTAAIDQIDFFYPVTAEEDCTFSGFVSFVGTSSMEVHLNVFQKFNGEDRIACSAQFVMVARTKDKKAYQIPKLNFQNEQKSFKFTHQMSRQRQQKRKMQAKKGLSFCPPSYQESQVIHQLSQNLKNHKSDPNFRQISSTTQKKSLLMHIENKNLSGKVFGGQILKNAYQLGWLCVHKYLKHSPPIISNVDSVEFLAPVEIGTYVDFESTIGYVTNKFVHVVITCKNSTFSGSSGVHTNTLRMTFEHDIQADKLPKVYPQSLEQSYFYIESMRRVKKLQSIA